ncbi:alanyl-tRNA synthetase [Lactobacillus colini]|uniref:Alanyl-tRNA synthetase n=1 Tax=Lactobacillus colini TaxID=1819254 RepID=A0ABS4ME34_9LACO|nr:hypothetical protein [Lactobacillus colini]MBP2057957.1 alanyl-tRNA synthetase [Lactobacillus colini]
MAMNDIQKAIKDYAKLQSQKESIIRKTQPEINEFSKKVTHEQKIYEQLLKAKENSQFIPIIASLLVMIIMLLCFSGII